MISCMLMCVTVIVVLCCVVSCLSSLLILFSIALWPEHVAMLRRLSITILQCNACSNSNSSPVNINLYLVRPHRLMLMTILDVNRWRSQLPAEKSKKYRIKCVSTNLFRTRDKKSICPARTFNARSHKINKQNRFFDVLYCSLSVSLSLSRFVSLLMMLMYGVAVHNGQCDRCIRGSKYPLNYTLSLYGFKFHGNNPTSIINANTELLERKFLFIFTYFVRFEVIAIKHKTEFKLLRKLG